MIKSETQSFAVERAMARLKVGLDGQSTPDCEWYDGILEDALDELQRAKDAQP